MLKEDMDKRILEKKLMCGELCDKDLESYLKDLPDVSALAEEIEL